MRILVTGGLGLIGSHVAELAHDMGHEVMVIDNLITGRADNLAPSAGLKIEIGDIADASFVTRKFDEFEPEAVVHAAASYKDPDDWLSDTLTNCVGGVNVISSSVRVAVKRFVYLQTALTYGLRPRENPISLDHPRDPGGSSYAISKTTNEYYLELSELDYVTFRLANVAGPRSMAGPLPIFYSRLVSGQKCAVSQSRRDFVYVKDLAVHVLMALDGVGSGVYHFSSGSDVSITELYDEVVNALGLSPYPTPEVVPVSQDDVGSILLDPSRTRQDFGDFEMTGIEELVRSAVSYYEAFGVERPFTHLRSFQT